MALRVLYVTPEITPFSKVGGLADVSAALPRALASLGCDVCIVTPRYGFIARQNGVIESDRSLPRIEVDIHGRPLGVTFSRVGDATDGLRIFFVDCDALYDRPGVYLDPHSKSDYLDNDIRFITLCRAALDLCRVLDWRPDIVHGQDWPAGVLPFYLWQQRAGGKMRRVRSVFTIHNLAYRGLFSPATVSRIGGAEKLFFPGGPLEFYGQVSLLKVALELADALNTVSPTYAREIQTSEEHGHGMESVLRARGDNLVGILNGIDEDEWNPRTDPHVKAPYDVESLDRKQINRRALCKRVGFEPSDSIPVIGMISRIVAQKGFEILAPVLADVLSIPARLVLLGHGDPHFEHVFLEFERHWPERFRVRLAFDDELAHLIEAGADMFLMPSKYEPCGLNQMMSMRYGTLPIVRATGGLADTVTDADDDLENATGFTFAEYLPDALLAAVRRAVEIFGDRARWRHMQRNAMSRDFSWSRSAREYVRLYERTLSRPGRIWP